MPSRRGGSVRFVNARNASTNCWGIKVTDEKGWLIERAPDGFPVWLQLDWSDTLWTTNSAEALRFAREVDAQRYVERHVPEFVRITEHMWLGRIPSHTASQGETKP